MDHFVILGKFRYLNDAVVFVTGRTAVKAKCVSLAIQAIHIAFAPCAGAVAPTDAEKSCV